MRNRGSSYFVISCQPFLTKNHNQKNRWEHQYWGGNRFMLLSLMLVDVCNSCNIDDSWEASSLSRIVQTLHLFLVNCRSLPLSSACQAHHSNVARLISYEIENMAIVGSEAWKGHRRTSLPGKLLPLIHLLRLIAHRSSYYCIARIKVVCFFYVSCSNIARSVALL